MKRKKIYFGPGSATPVLSNHVYWKMLVQKMCSFPLWCLKLPVVSRSVHTINLKDRVAYRWPGCRPHWISWSRTLGAEHSWSALPTPCWSTAPARSPCSEPSAISIVFSINQKKGASVRYFFGLTFSVFFISVRIPRIQFKPKSFCRIWSRSTGTV